MWSMMRSKRGELMTRRSGAERRSIVRRLAVAVIAGLIVHLLLFNFTKDDSDPPVCYSLVGYVVPCGNLSYAAASGAAGFVAVVLLIRRPGRTLRGVVAVGSHIRRKPVP
jgi:hypothetical protein